MKNKILPLQSLAVLNPSSIKLLSDKMLHLIENKLWAKVLTGMALGLIVGLLVSPTGVFSETIQPYTGFIQTTISWLALPAKLFFKLIQMVVIPLILASVIRGLASTKDVAQMKSLGIRFSLYVVVSSVFAATLGVILSNIFGPGRGLNLVGKVLPFSKNSSGFSQNTFSPDFLVDILPINPLSSIVEGQMLEVVVISIIGGIALISIKANQSEIILDILEVVQNICMTVISWAMKLAPFAVFGLITQVTASTGIKALQSMGVYVLTAFIGFISLIIIYVLIVSVVKKQSPFEYLKKIATPMLLAFSTSSSAASMPITMKTAEEELGIEPSTAGFLIPLGTTINMAGSAIWHTTAVVFLSQAYNVDLSFGQVTFVVATSIGAAIGSPGVPGVGIGILATVLGKVGIPIEGISLIMGVDRLVDMGCTVVNVTGDLSASVIFGKGKSHSG
ncbi:MAG: dicarboxylate/amino acid:cation symporter [Bdellovibrionales bacterium]|nr:dicarboxylate/amino acid:cation symporter [Bdellovibrionales bacterium]MCB0413535.1 dicarboxylate/amino acid:cation symporter [Bdellovibrionales bacterium]